MFDPKKEPVATFYARYFLENIFADCNISPKAFNIQILNEREKELFSMIREKKVNEVKLFSSPDYKASNTYQILKPDGNYNADDIKKMKYILCTKFYYSGIALLNDGSSYPF
mgnify:CR=1 FL=1